MCNHRRTRSRTKQLSCRSHPRLKPWRKTVCKSKQPSTSRKCWAQFKKMQINCRCRWVPRSSNLTTNRINPILSPKRQTLVPSPKSSQPKMRHKLPRYLIQWRFQTMSWKTRASTKIEFNRKYQSLSNQAIQSRGLQNHCACSKLPPLTWDLKWHLQLKGLLKKTIKTPPIWLCHIQTKSSQNQIKKVPTRIKSTQQ